MTLHCKCRPIVHRFYLIIAIISNVFRLLKIAFIFVLDSSGLDNDNAESGIGTATPPKEQVCEHFLFLSLTLFVINKKTLHIQNRI